MQKKISFLCFASVLMVVMVYTIAVEARPDATTKFSVIRKENPDNVKETLIIPYAFPSETMGTTLGVGGLAKGYHMLIPDGKRMKEIGIEKWIAEQQDRAKTGFAYSDIRCYPYSVTEE